MHLAFQFKNIIKKIYVFIALGHPWGMARLDGIKEGNFDGERPLSLVWMFELEVCLERDGTRINGIFYGNVPYVKIMAP